MKKIEPKYEFVTNEGDELVNPYKRTVAKTMEVTENFSPFDAMQYVAKMRKEKENKLAEIQGLEVMIKAYEDELDIINKRLGLPKLEKDFMKQEVERSKKMAKEEAKNKPVESPFVEEK